MAAVDSLAEMPRRCGLAPEAGELGFELRQLLYGRKRGRYRILFIIERRTVKILHIHHSARQPLAPDEEA